MPARVNWRCGLTLNDGWKNLTTKKKLMILYVISIPFIAYGVVEYFQNQSDLEKRLDNITLDMISCETIDNALYLNSISVGRNQKVDEVMMNLWLEGNCDNPDSPYWRGESWNPGEPLDVK